MRPLTCRRLTCLTLTMLVVTACGRGARDSDDAPKRRPPESQTPARTPAGDPIVRLEPTAQTRIGLRTEPAVTQAIQPELVAFGRLEEDPSRVFVLRAPFAGTLQTAAGHEWPRLGVALTDGATVGAIEPRLAFADRISLSNQLAAARADLTAATSSAGAAKAAYERARQLNADDKNVSDRALEEAAARLAAEDAKLETAQATVRLLENSLRPAGAATRTPLTIERGGEVVDVMAQPGEGVEAGTPILRVANFDRLLARVDIPVGDHLPPSALTARIVAVGHDDRPVAGQRIALSARAEPAAQGESILFRIATPLPGLRPGLAVTARISMPGPQRNGVVIPAAAVVRVSGKAYAFVQTGANEFVRREVALDQPIDGGYLAPSNFAAGDRIVVQGAQLLLTEEYKARIAAEAEKS